MRSANQILLETENILDAIEYAKKEAWNEALDNSASLFMIYMYDDKMSTDDLFEKLLELRK